MVHEEEKILNWDEIQNSFKKTFGSEVYNSWLQKISLIKENQTLIGVLNPYDNKKKNRKFSKE